MSGMAIVFMILVLGFYFGGFAWFTMIAMNAEKKKLK